MNQRISLLLESIVQCNFNVHVCYYFSKYIVFKVMTKSPSIANPAYGLMKRKNGSIRKESRDDAYDVFPGSSKYCF